MTTLAVFLFGIAVFCLLYNIVQPLPAKALTKRLLMLGYYSPPRKVSWLERVIPVALLSNSKLSDDLRRAGWKMSVLEFYIRRVINTVLFGIAGTITGSVLVMAFGPGSTWLLYVLGGEGFIFYWLWYGARLNDTIKRQQLEVLRRLPRCINWYKSYKRLGKQPLARLALMVESDRLDCPVITNAIREAIAVIRVDNSRVEAMDDMARKVDSQEWEQFCLFIKQEFTKGTAPDYGMEQLKEIAESAKKRSDTMLIAKKTYQYSIVIQAVLFFTFFIYLLVPLLLSTGGKIQSLIH